MNQSSKIFLASLVLTLLAALSCNKDFPSTNVNLSQTTIEGTSSDRAGGSGTTILGNQRANAFHVDIIKQAYNNLYNPDVSFITPTHLYVRFLPQNPEDVGELLKTDLDFWDYPLDRDVIYAGEYYHDPTVSDTNYTWMYAVVPPNFNFSAVSVSYQVLAPIVDIPENTLLAKTAFTLTNNLDIYEDTGNYMSAPTWNNGHLTWSGGEGTSEGSPEAGGCPCPVPEHT